MTGNNKVIAPLCATISMLQLYLTYFGTLPDRAAVHAVPENDDSTMYSTNRTEKAFRFMMIVSSVELVFLSK